MNTDADQPPGEGLVFISYPRAGTAGLRWAKDIEAWLLQNGVACFRDATGLLATAPVSRQLGEKIRQARLVLCVVSKATYGSDWVTTELALAAQQRLPVAHVVVERDAQRPEYGAANPAVDFTGSADEAWLALARALGLSDAAPRSPRRGLERDYLRGLLADRKFAVAARHYVPIGGEERSYESLVREYGEEYLPAPGRFERTRGRREPTSSERISDVIEVLEKSSRLAVLGAPGAGKSFALRRLATELATRALENESAPLPVFVPLGDWLAPLPEAPPTGADVDQFGRDAREKAVASLEGLVADTLAPALQPHLHALLRAGRLAPLFDGLNELPANARRLREWAVVQWINEHAACGGTQLLSCRVDDFAGGLVEVLDTLTLEPFTEVQVHDYIVAHVQPRTGQGRTADASRLFWHLAAGERALPVRMAFDTWVKQGHDLGAFFGCEQPPAGIDFDFWDEDARQAVRSDRNSLLRIAQRPFVLWQVVNLYVREGRSLSTLGGNRLSLCAAFATSSLEREHARLRDEHERDGGPRPPSLPDVESALRRLAWEMQTRGEAFTDPDAGQVALARTDALALGGAVSAATLDVAAGASLLELGERLRFVHQLYQECFAALELDARLPDHAARLIWQPARWWERTGWEEAARFVAGRRAAEPQVLVDWLADAQPMVLADCLNEPGVEPLGDAQRADLQARLMPRLRPEREPMPEVRHAVALALGRLGLDDRPGVGLREDGLPNIAWVKVPAGEFVWQKGERRKLAAFCMSRYPVTNSQFQAFIDAGGYEEACWWEELARRVEHPDTPRLNAPSRPRTDVSWFEAVAFCRWLTASLCIEIRLPVEQEWEKAARGPEGLDYPWGSAYCPGHANVREAVSREGLRHLRETTAVGVYPQGASPYGAEEMSGNVWEWCLNEYEDPDESAEDVRIEGGARRAMRGGSWTFDPHNARAAVRAGGGPVVAGDDVGFRVMCASHVPP